MRQAASLQEEQPEPSRPLRNEGRGQERSEGPEIVRCGEKNLPDSYNNCRRGKKPEGALHTSESGGRVASLR